MLGKRTRLETSIIGFILVLLFSTGVTAYASSSIQVGSDAPLAESEFPLHDPILIMNNTGFSSSGFTGSGTLEDPYVIEGFSFYADPRCISISRTTAYFVIRNCTLISHDYSPSVIYLNNAPNGNIENCQIAGANVAVSSRSSSNLTIVDTKITSSGTGIVVFHSELTNITRNNIYDCNMGIDLSNVTDGTISDNKIYANNYGGVWLGEGVRNILVYGNYLGWNTDGALAVGEYNANDDGEENQWYVTHGNVGVGNRWTDYIGGYVYAVDGNGQSFDRYPLLLTDHNDPQIGEPEGVTFEVGTSSNYLEWLTGDEFPHLYSVSIDDEFEIARGTWHNGRISVNIDILEIGDHTVRLQLIDASGNFVSSLVPVRVVQPIGYVVYTIIVVGLVVSVAGVLMFLEIRERK